MKTIFKYSIMGRVRHREHRTFSIPKNSRILSCQNQHGRICIWMLVDTSKEDEFRTFHVAGTGKEFSSQKLKFVATVQCFPYTWHVFEEVV